jgi:hypothetical protein
MSSSFVKIPTSKIKGFYNRYDGHNAYNLNKIVKDKVVCLPDDSSMHELNNQYKPLHTYKNILVGKMKQDVCYAMNRVILKSNSHHIAQGIITNIVRTL